MLVHILFIGIMSALLASGGLGLARHGHGRGRLGPTFLASAIALGGISLMLASARWFPPLTEDPAGTVLSAFALSLPFSIAVAFLNVPLQRLRNPLGTINPILPASILALTLACSTLSVAGWQRFANGWLDTSPPAIRLAEVIESSATQAVILFGDKEKAGLHDIDPKRVKAGVRLAIHVRAGYYAAPWISGYEVINNEKATD